MEHFCEYCKSLHRAYHNQNYCSNSGDTIDTVLTNAYYFKSSNLCSGNHVSRFSIRTISDGYQYHKVGKKEFLLDKYNYLIINEGEEFKSEITTNHPLEGILVAFSQEDINAFAKYFHLTDRNLLDDPFAESHAIGVETKMSYLTPKLISFISLIKYAIKNWNIKDFYYDQLFLNILSEFATTYNAQLRRIDALKASKRSTREEIYRRLKVAKEAIDLNCTYDYSINKLSKIASMSSFHFLRSFQAFYGVSPHKYITQKRIHKAQFLLKDSEMTIKHISQEVGFESDASFGRSFKASIGMTPMEYRITK